MSTPTISTIIPTYDRSTHLLAQALDSVLDQTHVPNEIIVVDDGSDEPVGPWIAENYGDRVRALRIEHAGISAARNAGVAAAGSSMLSFLDSDDLWFPRKLESQLALLEADSELEAVFGQAEQFFDPDTSSEHRARYPIRSKVIDAWLSAALLIRTEAFERIGPFPQRSSAVDIDWMFRASDLHLRRHMLPEVVYRRRIHTNNISIQESSVKNGLMLSAVRDSLARRRAAAAAD
ncbi:MAG: glycosyltransferase family 2 protein [Ilumatobacter sp.]